MPFADLHVNRHGATKSARQRRLYEFATYASTPRLKQLVAGEIEPTYHDIFELFNMLRQSESFSGVRPNLRDFAEWILNDGAEVLW